MPEPTYLQHITVIAMTTWPQFGEMTLREIAAKAGISIEQTAAILDTRLKRLEGDTHDA